MKKIMFNDKFGLTDAVLQGRKTVTRRIVTDEIFGESSIEKNPPRIDEIQRGVNSKYIKSHLAQYQVGEVIAIAQRYKDIVDTLKEPCMTDAKCWMPNSAGWNNKMFVKAEFMPHQIKIPDVRVERLQDITDEDCIKEGIVKLTDKGKGKSYGIVLSEDEVLWLGFTHREAFAFLIDKLSGKGTWERNPYVFRYEFELQPNTTY